MSALDIEAPQSPLPDTPLAITTSTKVKTGPDGKAFAYDESTGRVVALHGPAEQLITLLDGTHNFESFLSVFGVALDDVENPRHQALSKFIVGMHLAGMLVTDEITDDPTAGSDDFAPTDVEFEFEHLLREVPPGWKARVHLPLRSAEDFILERSKPALLWAIAVAGVLGFLGHLFVFTSFGLTVGRDGEVPDRTVGVIILAIVVLIGQLTLHEASHGLALRLFGLRVREIGVRFWFYVMPAPYVSQAGEVFLPSRRQRVIVALAGIICDGFTGVVAWLVLVNYVSAEAALGWAMFHLGLLMMNLNPLLPTDGARCVEAALGEVSLRTRSVRWAKAAVLRQPPPPGSPTTWGKQAYGALSLTLLVGVGLYLVVRVATFGLNLI